APAGGSPPGSACAPACAATSRPRRERRGASRADDARRGIRSHRLESAPRDAASGAARPRGMGVAPGGKGMELKEAIGRRRSMRFLRPYKPVERAKLQKML